MTPPSDQSVGPGAVLFFYFQREISSLVLFKPFPSGEGDPKGWTSPKPSPWGEGGWPLGQTDEGTMTGHVRLSRGVAAPAARYFPSDGKVPKGSPGDAAGANSVRHDGLPPDPHYGGRVLVRFCKISGAQNLSGWCLSLPGHWALGLHKFPLVRFHNCAWIYRANAPGVEYAVGAGVLTRPPGVQICFREAVGAALAVARAGCRIRFRFPL